MWNLTYEKRKKTIDVWKSIFVYDPCLLGCSPEYYSECSYDKSDHFICPASACHGSPSRFPCSDGKYCIMKSLVCDGYAQCEDESGNSQSSNP